MVVVDAVVVVVVVAVVVVVVVYLGPQLSSDRWLCWTSPRPEK